MRMSISCLPTILFHLLLIVQFAYTTLADDSFSLNTELKNFVPACAQACFVSFLENNFPTSVCTTDPTLDCLCSTGSKSGFTIGEAAIQCIISEIKVGSCRGNDAEDTVITDAFTMCNGKENALPNTHKTLTATFFVPTSSGITLPAATTRPLTLSTSTRSTTTRNGSSSSTTGISSIITAPPTLLTSPGASQTSDSSSQTSVQALPDTSAANRSLTTPQIAGITAAAVGGAAIIVGLIILCACLRRRRQRQRDSDMIPFQSDPTMSKFGLGIRPPGSFRGMSEFSKSKSSNFEAPNGTWKKVAPPVPPRLDTSDPYMFSRRSIRPDTIGLAISPDRQIPARENRASRLLPERPALTLNTGQASELPGSGSKPYLPIYAQMSRLQRQSSATQFEEDDEDNNPYTDESFGRRSGDRILGPPQAPPQAQMPTIKMVPPESVPPEFFVTSNYPTNLNPPPPAALNRDSNAPMPAYVNKIPTSQYSTAPVAVGRGVGSFSRPRPTAPGELQVPGHTSSQTATTRSILPPGSSIYSSTSNTTFESGPNTSTSAPFPLSYPPPIRTSTGPKLKSLKQDRASTGSVDSWEQDNSPTKENRGTIMLDLSPVAESPSSPQTGISPVSYPKIPPRSPMNQMPPSIRMVPPPAQPDFASVFSSGRAGTRQNQADKMGSQNGIKPWQAAEMEAARRRRMSQDQAQEAQARQAEVRARAQQQARGQQANWTLQQQITPTKPLQVRPKLGSPFQPRTESSQTLPTQVQPRTYSPPSQAQSKALSQQKAYIAPSAHFNNSPTPLHLQPQHARKNSNSGSIASQNSTNSSLLAKRLGAERAAALQLHTPQERGGSGGNNKTWRVLGLDEKERAKDAGWRPQLANGGGRELDGDQGTGGLPRTPGWVPKLTPTRRGNELFLSVA
ncbi:hypothetical protein B0O99DRAFT_384574 [Bisporella sp. PMI_857]|nr:hypothetical protein B0O99DRAFT_384574 [Bisporella sp. PMI_857]